ncbi:four helix bundle protein [Candidatus Microgenomates bacterium]|nr:four helix bundle protein [Candidatus Microgenomates bacterium]
MAIKSFLDLQVYQEALLLAKEVHSFISTLPKDEKYLLADQTKRASRAIPSLIAEAWSHRELTKEFRSYLRDTIGETNEMMSHLEQARLFGYLDESKARSLIERYDKLAAKLSKLKNNWRTFP